MGLGEADAEFDQDLVESEDYDTVEEDYEDVDVVARNMNEDLQLLEEEVMFELKNWCNGEHDNDPVCLNME